MYFKGCKLNVNISSHPSSHSHSLVGVRSHALPSSVVHNCLMREIHMQYSVKDTLLFVFFLNM